MSPTVNFGGGGLVSKSCPTLCDPLDCSPPGFSVHGILHARALEQVAIPSPGDLPDSGIEPVSLVSPTLQVGSSPTEPSWKRLVQVNHFL